MASGAINNTTTPVASDVFPGQVDTWTTIQYSINTILSAISIPPNLIISLTILSCKNLRQRNDLIIFVAFAIGETYSELAILVGSLRYFVLPAGTPFMTPFECMQCFHVTPNICAQFMLMMLCVISLDRMVCVTQFNRHQSFGKLYPLGMISVPLAIQAISLTVVWMYAATSPSTLRITPLCITSKFLPQGYILFNNLLTLCSATGSVALYGAVMVTFRMKTDHSQFEGIKKVQVERERKITKLLGIMSLVTLVFFAIPQMTYMYVTFTYSYLTPTPTWYLYLLQGLTAMKLIHSTCYSSIYLARPNDVRARMLEMVRFVTRTSEHSSSPHFSADSSSVSGSTRKRGNDSDKMFSKRSTTGNEQSAHLKEQEL